MASLIAMPMLPRQRGSAASTPRPADVSGEGLGVTLPPQRSIIARLCGRSW